MYCGERKLLKNLQIDHKYPVAGEVAPISRTYSCFVAHATFAK